MPIRLVKDMRNSQFSKETTSYFWETERLNNLTEEEEIVLAKQMREGDNAARERLINSQLEHVVVISCKHYYKLKDSFGNCIIPLEDLCCEGNLGLLYAIDHFDPDKGRWPSYAKYWIEKYVIDALNEERSKKFSNTNHGKKESEEETLIPVQSFDTYKDNFEDSSKKDIPDNAPTPEDIVLRQSIKEDFEKRIQYYLGDCSERDRRIFNMYFGLAGEREKTEKQIGQVLGLTENQVKRVLTVTRRKLYSKERTENRKGLAE